MHSFTYSSWQPKQYHYWSTQCGRILPSFSLGYSWQLKKVLVIPYNHPLQNLDIPTSATAISWSNEKAKVVSQTPMCGRNHTLPQDHHTVLWLTFICPDNKSKAQSFQKSTRKTTGHRSFVINIPSMPITNAQYPNQPPQCKLKLLLRSQSRCVQVMVCRPGLLP